MVEFAINTQDYLTAIQFIPKLQDFDISSDKTETSRGAEEIVKWFVGSRVYLGSPTVCWPSARGVLEKFDNKITNWYKGVSTKPESITLNVDLVGRFTKLIQIYEHLEKTCPSHLRENLLQHAKDADIARGKCSLSAWWDRINTNASCHKQAVDILLQLPCLKQTKSLNDSQFDEFVKNANEIKTDACGGADHCGESHLLNGRQKFSASDKLKLLKSAIQNVAGSQALSKKARLSYVPGAFQHTLKNTLCFLHAEFP